MHKTIFIRPYSKNYLILLPVWPLIILTLYTSAIPLQRLRCNFLTFIEYYCIIKKSLYKGVDYLSDWDFLWDLSPEEAAEATGDVAGFFADYIEEQNEEIRQRAERRRIKARNKAWKELKILRDSGAISREDFKQRKDEIFAFENEQKRQKNALIKKIKEYQKYSQNNRERLRGSIKCACYGCLSTILVYNLFFDGDTAICPNCDSKTIVPFSDDILEHIQLIHDYYCPNDELADDYY